MPIYQYECPRCHKVTEAYHNVDDRHNEYCEECDCKMSINICTTSVHLFEPFFHPHLDTKPVYIKSKKHLKEEAAKRNMTAYY